jgi:hypothetical protein
MQFEVNGKNYFLQFSSEEGQWFLLTPGRSGVERYVIANDTESSEFADVIIPSEPDPYVN